MSEWYFAYIDIDIDGVKVKGRNPQKIENAYFYNIQLIGCQAMCTQNVVSLRILLWQINYFYYLCNPHVTYICIGKLS